MQILWWLHYEKFSWNSVDLMKNLTGPPMPGLKLIFRKLHAVFRKSFFLFPPSLEWTEASLSYQRLKWVESFSSKPKSNLGWFGAKFSVQTMSIKFEDIPRADRKWKNMQSIGGDSVIHCAIASCALPKEV